MHGTESDPVFCYANCTAQALWGHDWDAFIGMPSRLSAEPEVQPERELLLRTARKRDFMSDFQGIRIAKDGQRFAIRNVILWNVVGNGVRHGQAAVFRQWAPVS